eukprot:2013125-Rhodomonas_salina.1
MSKEQEKAQMKGARGGCDRHESAQARSTLLDLRCLRAAKWEAVCRSCLRVAPYASSVPHIA